MPELPEVETVKRGLAPVVEGATIEKADVNRPDLRWPFPDKMGERLTGARVKQLARRSKYLLFELENDETLLVHLGMSGRLLVSGDPLGSFVHDHPAQDKHDHVVLHMDNGARVTFNDPRRFGSMDLFPTWGPHRLLNGLGPEPLGNGFSEAYLIKNLKGKTAPIKSALLDQGIVAGLGNIYVCEALFRAGISPVRKAGDIEPDTLSRLHTAIRDVLKEAIEAGGSSLRDFRQTDGELGYFQHKFDVYGREGEVCHTPGCTTVIDRIVQSGRSSFFCPTCQR